jgi:hypothetical protein
MSEHALFRLNKLFHRGDFIRATDKHHVDMALEMAEHSREHYVRKTVQFVNENWDVIVAVAEELIRERRISGQRLDEIIKAAKHVTVGVIASDPKVNPL